MLKILYSNRFGKAVKMLPTKEQDKLANLLNLLKENQRDPLLHCKSLSGKLAGHFSFRITRDWRALYRFLDVNTIVLLEVRHRKEIYR